jgi:MFS family permease
VPETPSHRPAAAAPSFRATVIALALAQTLSWAALYYAFSSFVLPMMRETGWDKPTTMGAFTLGLAMSGLCSYAAGAAIDRGQGRALMTGGSVAAGLGFIAWSFVHTAPGLYAVWALLGATMAFTLYEPAFAVLTKRYPQQYLKGITAVTLVAGFASTLSFPACAWLNATVGWRTGVQLMGAMMLLVVVPLNAWALRGTAIGQVARAHDAAADATLHQALRTPAFWLLTICFTAYAFAGAALWAHVVPAFAAKEVSEAAAVAIVVWIGPAQVAGRFVYAWLGRAIPLRTVGLVVMLTMPLSLALFALGSASWTLIVFALLFGLSNGLVTIVRGGLVPSYFGHAHVGRIGGAMSGAALLARAAAPLGAAWLLVALETYRSVWLVMAAVSSVAALCFWLARPPGE